LKERGLGRVVIGDKEDATLVAEGIFPYEYYSPFDADNRQTLRYANRGGTIYAKEEQATYTAAFIEPMECLPVPCVPEGAEWACNIVGGYRLEVVRSGHLAEESPSRQLCSFISRERRLNIQGDWICIHWPTSQD
jgi:hypothetical protein